MIGPQGVDEIEFNASSGINYQDISGGVLLMHSGYIAQAINSQGVWSFVGIGEGKGVHVRYRINLASKINQILLKLKFTYIRYNYHIFGAKVFA